MKTHEDFEIGDVVRCESNRKSGKVIGFFEMESPLLSGFPGEETHLLQVKQKSGRVSCLIPALCTKEDVREELTDG